MISSIRQQAATPKPKKAGGDTMDSLRDSQPLDLSPILSMHARYEQTMAEYNIVDQAEGAARKDDDDYHQSRYSQALKALTRETDALRVAILHQVPVIWKEVMILQFHIVNAFDMHANCAGEPPEAEKEALQTAIDTVFDFMCCEIDTDHEKVGAAFQDGASHALWKRRYRTGSVEE